MAGQYEDAFSPRRLQNWSVPRPSRQRPSVREGSTPIVADDRGHLLPTVPRSQASPWGTFVGTWDMPPRIPPARLDLTSRSAAAAARLLAQIRQPTALTRACNGLRTEITGKPQEPRWDTQTTKEPSRRSSPAPSEGIQPAGPPLERPPVPRAGATAPEPPAAPQPGSHPSAVTDPRCGDAGSPQIPASSCPAAREASPQQGTPLPAGGAPWRPSPGVGGLRVSPRVG